jgi:hypothetical protein
MLNVSMGRPSLRKPSTSFARRLLMTAAVVALPAVANAQSSQPDAQASATTSPTFFTLDNPGDPNFNQLLGINDGRVIVGYFGDGTVVANNGYVLVPQNHYSVENFLSTPATQTQAIGINNRELPEIVGFYTDSQLLNTHGFLDVEGVQSTIDDPQGVFVIGPAIVIDQNLLGINDNNEAAGFWIDPLTTNEHGFVVQINTQNPAQSKFIEVPPTTFKNGVADQVSGITDRNEICGSWTDSNKVTHGFFGILGQRLTSFDVKIKGLTVTSTSPLGCNNRGEIVGTFTDSKGNVQNVHGFIFSGGRFVQFDAPGSSQTSAFGVMGTTINGVNDLGDIVGFYSDGTKVHGFVNFAQPVGPETAQN